MTAFDVVVAAFDVVVVGGGIAGMSAGWELAASLSVAVVEAEAHLGMHTTGRSAAMLNETSGTPAVCRLASQSRAFLATPPDGFATGPLLSPRGLVWVGVAGAGDRLATTHANAPAASEIIAADAVLALVPRLRPAAAAAGGVHEPGAMAIDVAGLLDGYRRGFAARSGRVFTSSQAVVLQRTRVGWDVTAGPHQLQARVVVDAAGAWGDVVAERAGIRPLGLRPLRRTAALVPAPDDVAAWPMVMDVDGGWYVEPESGGLLISAADETPSDPTDAQPEEIDVAQAIERVNEAFDLGIRSVRRAWAGLRTFALDRVPVAGPDPTDASFVWLVGQGGAGIKTAPALAAHVAEAIVHARAVPPEIDPARFR